MLDYISNNLFTRLFSVLYFKKKVGIYSSRMTDELRMKVHPYTIGIVHMSSGIEALFLIYSFHAIVPTSAKLKQWQNFYSNKCGYIGVVFLSLISPPPHFLLFFMLYYISNDIFIRFCCSSLSKRAGFYSFCTTDELCVKLNTYTRMIIKNVFLCRGYFFLFLKIYHFKNCLMAVFSRL